MATSSREMSEYSPDKPDALDASVSSRPAARPTPARPELNGRRGAPLESAPADGSMCAEGAAEGAEGAGADMSPVEIFERVVVNDAKQNKRLSSNFVGFERAGGAASKGGSSRANASEGPKGSTKMRFIVCTLGLMSLAMSQMSRMVINQSITQMVEPSVQGSPPKKEDSVGPRPDIASDGSCPWPEEPVVDERRPAPEGGTEDTSTQSSAATWPASTPGQGKLSTTSQTTQLGEEATAKSSSSAADESMAELPDFDEVLAANVDENRAGPPPEGSAANSTNTAPGAPAGYERFNWSMKQQSVVLGGFYYSYFVFMVLGGRMAEVYGAKYVILLAVAGSALINLATPWMARTSLGLLVMSRVIMGAIQSGVFPAMYALIAKWLTMSEASIFAPLIKMNLRLGMVFGSLIPGIVPGWPNVFYFTGFLSALWSLAWIFVATSDPADNAWVSEGELRHINRKKKAKTKTNASEEPVEPFEEIELELKSEPSSTCGDNLKQKQQQQPQQPQQPPHMGNSTRDGRESSGKVQSARRKPARRSLKTPWRRIWTSPSVVGLIIVKLTFNYALDFLAIELPSYLKYVHHASRQTISAITTPMFGIQVFLIVFVGWLAKVVIQRRPLGMSKTAIRKSFQGVASFGLSLSFLLLTFNGCNLTYVAVLLQIVSFLSMFTAGGETMLPYDLSEEYPATIMSIANSIANISGVTTTTLAGIILGDQGGSYDRWNLLIYLIASANLLGGLAFTCLVSAEPIDFSSKKERENRGPRKDKDLEAQGARSDGVGPSRSG